MAFGCDKEHCEPMDVLRGASGASGEAAERELARTRHELSVAQAVLARLATSGTWRCASWRRCMLELAHTMLTPNHPLNASIDEAIEHAMCADLANDDGEGEDAAGAASAKRPSRKR